MTYDYTQDLADAEKALEEAERDLVEAQAWAMSRKAHRDMYKRMIELESRKLSDSENRSEV